MKERILNLMNWFGKLPKKILNLKIKVKFIIFIFLCILFIKYIIIEKKYLSIQYFIGWTKNFNAYSVIEVRWLTEDFGFCLRKS